MLRMTRANWEKFKKGKKTTIRITPKSPGIHRVFGGPRFKPVLLGYVELGSFNLSGPRTVREITEADAVMDGFKSRDELIIELAHLNRQLTLDTTIFIHPIRVVSEEYALPRLARKRKK